MNTRALNTATLRRIRWDRVALAASLAALPLLVWVEYQSRGYFAFDGEWAIPALVWIFCKIRKEIKK